ncbi:tungsten ABC transporter substrate-binding protein [Desulfuribacillus stibiiarsenatis]|uniref:Tungsten ABC transporter substrate-binding protein n=1 Tax=Desulfuribacillus stibiiarsenatis TaxID=1390249 RepID=A0A1E5L4A4_9FIRM|nr:substrate-binding domain-containing protein [Desulfuribacillus stibiiarsenatis]OEH84947.1 tungsten ABC transporter substrate-binding protein [Desulfuribacillus stibiiarsenatis]
MQRILRSSMFLFLLLIILLSVFSFSGCSTKGSQQANQELILATTTSTSDTGLLDVLIPVFKEKTGIVVKVISVGTGQALELGKNGDCDVILVHARASEDQFVLEEFGVNRRDVMYNDFVIIGPKNDPAGIKGKAIDEAFRLLNQGKSKFISRGDESGTHKKEVSVWESVGIEPKGNWYLSIGKGMGDSINMANEVLGYTLTDRGTFIKMESEMDIEILIEGDRTLLNPYGIISISPDKHAHANYDGAEAFAEFITSQEGKDIINGFQLEGKQLFFTE